MDTLHRLEQFATSPKMVRRERVQKLAEHIRTKTEPPLSEEEALAVTEMLPVEKDDETEEALWSLLLLSPPYTSMRKHVQDMLAAPDMMFRAYAWSYLYRLSSPSDKEHLLETHEHDPDAEVRFEVALKLYSAQPEKALRIAMDLLEATHRDYHLKDSVELFLFTHGTANEAEELWRRARDPDRARYYQHSAEGLTEKLNGTSS